MAIREGNTASATDAAPRLVLLTVAGLVLAIVLCGTGELALLDAGTWVLEPGCGAFGSTNGGRPP
jgi:hypothetical protein